MVPPTSPPGYHPVTIWRPRHSCRAVIMTVWRKVLIIEDDDVIAQGMARHLQAAGFDTIGVANGETGLARLRFERPDVCVLDLMLPGLDGWKVIEQARSEGIGTPIVVVSARGTEHDRVHALEIGADDYLVKPFSMKELVSTGRRCRPARHARAGLAAWRRARDRGAPARPAQRSGVRRRYERRPHADRVPPALCARPRPAAACSLATSSSSASGVAVRRIATGRSTSSCGSCARRSTTAPRRHTFLQTRYGVGYKLEPEPK